MTIVLYFTDHKPFRLTGSYEFCVLQIANAKAHKTFVSWDVIPDRVETK